MAVRAASCLAPRSRSAFAQDKSNSPSAPVRRQKRSSLSSRVNLRRARFAREQKFLVQLIADVWLLIALFERDLAHGFRAENLADIEAFDCHVLPLLFRAHHFF